MVLNLSFGVLCSQFLKRRYGRLLLGNRLVLSNLGQPKINIIQSLYMRFKIFVDVESSLSSLTCPDQTSDCIYYRTSTRQKFQYQAHTENAKSKNRIGDEQVSRGADAGALQRWWRGRRPLLDLVLDVLAARLQVPQVVDSIAAPASCSGGGGHHRAVQ